jgi:hypothetical protein
LSASTLTAPADTRRDGITRFYLQSPTPADVDWSSRFDDYTVRAFVTDFELFEKEGFRFAVSLRINDSKRTISIRLRTGADEADYQFGRRQVGLILAGHYRAFPWETSADGTYQHVLLGYPVGDNSRRYPGDQLMTCSNRLCENFGDLHTFDPSEPHTPLHRLEDRPIGVGYDINVVKRGVGSWEVDVVTEESFTGDAARRFAVDLCWAAGEADKVNRLEAEGQIGAIV